MAEQKNTLDELSKRRLKNKKATEEESQLAKQAAPLLKNDFRFDIVSGQFFQKAGNIWQPVNDVIFLKKVFEVLDILLPGGFSSARLKGIKDLIKAFLKCWNRPKRPAFITDGKRRF